ncbi:MAG: homocysteine S-methyltransferase family protein, partial [Paludibacteraceae bacterium]|nr:homocysteine S-methyltransferase family protein [Paludibacteraceae bacterium]
MRKQLQNRILILDGGYGTMIQSFGIQGNNDALPMENPDVIAKIHRGYLEAGADIVSTCSFGAQRISQAEYGMQGKIREMNIAAAKLARKEADRIMEITPDRPRFVAGSVGPTGKMLSMSENADDPAARSVSFDEITDAYEEQMSALIEGGVDAFLIETIFDTLNSKAALVAAERAMKKMGRRVELMLSLTISDNSGRSLSGQTIEAFIASVSHAPLLSIGLNCGLGAEALLPYLRRICEVSPFYVSCHPNAGLPNALGKYVDTPFKMRSELAPFFDEGLLNIIGGCCGTTPDHIAAINEEVEKGHAKIHKINAIDKNNLVLSGLEPLSVANLPEDDKFLKIGERCNVAGSRKFLKLINEKCYDEALEIARKQVEGGANVIDINMDDGLLDAKTEMSHFVRLIASDPEIARLPLRLDSSRFEVIEEALKWTQGKCIVNSISLKEGEEKFLDHARVIRQFGAAVIVMAFDEEGQATTFDRKIEICGRAYRLLRDNLDFPSGDIIFDPNVL